MSLEISVALLDLPVVGKVLESEWAVLRRNVHEKTLPPLSKLHSELGRDPALASAYQLTK